LWLKAHLSAFGYSIFKGFCGPWFLVDVVYSADEERELRERIRRLVDEERRVRNERHQFEARLRALVMARYMELFRRFGGLEEGY
jgi:hypothetical protein